MSRESLSFRELTALLGFAGHVLPPTAPATRNATIDSLHQRQLIELNPDRWGPFYRLTPRGRAALCGLDFQGAPSLRYAEIFPAPCVSPWGGAGGGRGSRFCLGE